MSFRNMLKVSFLMLLAMALVATSVHARLDLFGQLLTSKNQPEPNSDAAKACIYQNNGDAHIYFLYIL
ncbi:hypothetical protein ABKV19_026342 [Rosa sericea]